MTPLDPPPAAPEPGFPSRVAAVRRFNRFYTQRIGVLSDRYLGEALTLTQSRILYEIAHRDSPTAGEIIRDLGIDQGYVSRILAGFERAGLVRRTKSATDGRKSHLALTAAGRAELDRLDARANEEVGRMLAALSPADQARVVAAMELVEAALGGRGPAPGTGSPLRGAADGPVPKSRPARTGPRPRATRG